MRGGVAALSRHLPCGSVSVGMGSDRRASSDPMRRAGCSRSRRRRLVLFHSTLPWDEVAAAGAPSSDDDDADDALSALVMATTGVTLEERRKPLPRPIVRRKAAGQAPSHSPW